MDKRKSNRILRACAAIWIAATASVYAGTWGDLTYTIYYSRVNITDCNPSVSGDLVIPSTIEGYPVSSISKEAFAYCTGLTGVTIPDTVDSIGSSAFYYCVNLTSITLPDSVVSVRENAFRNCSGLTNVTFSGQMNRIYDYTFYNCSELMHVTIPEHVSSIGYNAFKNTSIPTLSSNNVTYLLTTTSAVLSDGRLAEGELDIPNELNGLPVRLIEDRAFSGCTGLTSVTLSTNATHISATAFGGCSLLTNITIPDSVYYIGGGAFSYCSSLASITIPDSVYSIGEGAFGNCSSLTRMTFPDRVRIISPNIFSGCSSLTNVTLPNIVTDIGDEAFSSCTSLASLTIPDDITRIGHAAFSGCTNLTKLTIPVGVKEIENNAFVGSAIPSLTTNNITYALTTTCAVLTEGDQHVLEGSLVIPKEVAGLPVLTIASEAFLNSPGLTSVTIPNGVRFIGSDAFRNCHNLMDVILPDSVASIRGGAFQSCSSLASITIPSSVTFIQHFLFNGCTNLSTVNFHDGVKGIGYGTFDGCSSLTNMTIPNSVICIGRGAFEDCSSLTSVTIPDAVTDIQPLAFSGCSSLTNVTIGEGVTLIETDTFTGTAIPMVSSNNVSYMLTENCAVLVDGHEAEGHVVIPDVINGLPLRFIESKAFRYNTGLTGVTIPYGVTTIGSKTFAGTSIPTLTSNQVDYMLTSSYAVLTDGSFAKGTLHIPSEVAGLPVRIISRRAFDSCLALTSVTVPESVSIIDNFTFFYCRFLASVRIPDSVTYIGEGAFLGCDSLSDVTIPDSVSYIGRYAFIRCFDLKYVAIPSSVLSMEEGVFQQCHRLTTALFKGDAPMVLGRPGLFYDTSRDFKVQFYEGAEGFTTPTWRGYPCEMLPSFGTWALDLPEEQRGPADAPDGDGIPNLVKYATGLPPGSPHSSADLFDYSVVTSPSNSAITLTYFKDPRAFGVSLYPIASPSLTNTAWSADGITTFDTGNMDLQGRNIWGALLPTENTRGFMRLSAEAN